jgi:hypothetical protein
MKKNKEPLCSNRFACRESCTGKGIISSLADCFFSTDFPHLCRYTNVHVSQVYPYEFSIEIDEELFKL